jgi:Zn-dependent metalloprotease
VAENARAWSTKGVRQCGKSLGQSSSLKNLVLLDAVDIHFMTQNYVQFLHETLNVNSVEVPPVDGRSVIASIHNVPNLDNAYFTGECMIYGNGDRMFKPLGCADVAGHELGHSFSKQEYVGHAGALNESFADVMGVSFEFWLYKKYNEDADKSNDILGAGDWTIGEDIGDAIKFLRNMADPTQAQQPQPKKYRGQFWADPNAREDEGGVHTNSGVSNYCFYLCAQHMSLLDALRLFFDCFRSLSKRATFIEFRDKLIRCCGDDKTMVEIARGALDEVGLTRDAVSDWR